MSGDMAWVSKDVFRALEEGGRWSLWGWPPDGSDMVEVTAHIEVDEYVTVDLYAPDPCTVHLGAEWLAGAAEICRHIQSLRDEDQGAGQD